MTGIILLGKNGLSIYDDKTKKIFQLNFKPDVVRNLEVVNSDQLNLNIKSLIDSNKIAPSSMIMIVSHNMFFEKDFQALTKEQQIIETQKFLDNIPFEVVASVAFSTEKNYKIIAGNGHFIEEVKKAFGALGFNINIVLPSIAFGNIGERLNEAAIKIVLNKHGGLKQYNLLKEISQAHQPTLQEESEEQKEKGEQGGEGEEKESKKISKKNLIAIVIFVVFIVVLSVIVYITALKTN